jgi:hypothetical protein
MHRLDHRHRLARAYYFIHADEARLRRPRTRLVVGGALLGFGVAWLLQRQGVIGTEGLWLTLPAVLAWSGLVRLALYRDAVSVVSATMRLALAAYLSMFITQAGALTWAGTWPALLIYIGVGTLIHPLVARMRADRDGEGAW